MQVSNSLIPKDFKTCNKRKSLSLLDKLNIIRDFENSGLTKRKFAALKNIVPSTLATILKNRKSIEENATLININRKKVRSGKFEDLEKILMEWYHQARSARIPTSGPIILEKAKEIADRLDIDDFSGSTGWLDRFKTRHGISYKTNYGEPSVSPAITSTWKTDLLPHLIDQYEPCDIYSAEEFGLFFKLMPNKSYIYKGEKCHEGKLSKERLTVLACTNSTGTDKLRLLVIGKFDNPNCFENVKSFPCDYSAQPRAWMTEQRFTEWLQNWNKELQKSNRNVILFVDNCAAHQTKSLSNIQLEFLPPNATSELKPLDQGIIKVIKQRYRNHVVQRFDQIYSDSKISITLLDALHFLTAAWREVSATTISNSFKKSGFILPNIAIKTEEVDIEDDWGQANIPDIEGFVTIDDDVITSDIPNIAVANCLKNEEIDVMDDEDDIPIYLPEKTETLEALRKVRFYFHSVPDISEHVFQQIHFLETKVLESSPLKFKREKLDDYEA